MVRFMCALMLSTTAAALCPDGALQNVPTLEQFKDQEVTLCYSTQGYTDYDSQAAPLTKARNDVESKFWWNFDYVLGPLKVRTSTSLLQAAQDACASVGNIEVSDYQLFDNGAPRRKNDNYYVAVAWATARVKCVPCH